MNMSMLRAILIIEVLAVGLCPGAARADDVPDAVPDAPRADDVPEQKQGPLPTWHKGVSDAQKQRAGEHFTRALGHHQAYEYTQALDAYKAALAEWDNPKMHHNLGLLYHKLGQPLLAYQHLTKVLGWGPQALTATQRAEAETLIETLLAKRLGRMEVRSDEPGTAVSLNGEALFVGPGSANAVLLPGNQVITAKKAGHYSVIETVAQRPGQHSVVAVTLSEDRVHSHRRWAAWLPWAVLGAGAAVGLAGGGLRWRAGVNVDAAERALATGCGGEVTCDVQQTDLYDRVDWQNNLGMGAIALGGAVVAVGLVGLWLNQPKAERSADKSGARIDSKPLIWNRGAGWSVNGRF